MSYVNVTGVNIGNCLTGFGIHFPVTISNSGNSEVFYTLDNSNVTNFDLSKDSFSISPNNYTTFDILYNPTISSPSSDEETLITISSTSVEDGSTDPSGNISLYITGTKIIDITGGNPRSFRVVSNYEGPIYDFYWKAPTGITGDNLHNYFITGYRLDLSTTTSFSSPDFTKYINVAKNNNIDPSYSTFYGFSDEDVFYRLSTNEFPSLTVNQNYYARLHSLVNNNSGVSIYASGVDSVSQSVSEEVFLGYSGTPINLKIEKKAFDLYIDYSTWYSYTYDLYAKLIEKNNGSNDFKQYSGINIYLPENSRFESTDLTKGAIDLNGTFLNLTGNNSIGTNINIYIPSSTQIIGRIGNGTNIPWKDNWTKDGFQGGQNFINTVVSTPGYSDSTNGGPALSLKASTNINNQGIVTDIKYNIYSKLSDPKLQTNFLNGLIVCNPSISSGSGGGKGGFFYPPYFVNSTNYFYFYDTVATSNKLYFDVIPVNAALTKDYLLNRRLNRNFWIWWVYRFAQSRVLVDLDTVKPLTATDFASEMYIPYAQDGDIGVSNLVVRYPDGKLKYTPKLKTRDSNAANLINAKSDNTSFYKYGNWMPINTNLNNRQPGYLIDSFTNASINFSLYNNILPSDYVFRFKNSDIVNNTTWNDVSNTIQLTNSSGSNTGNYVANYKNLGASSYKTINLVNNQYLQVDFSNSTSFGDFDLFLICSFDDFSLANDLPIYSSLFDWTYSNSISTSRVKNQFIITKNDPLYAPTQKDDILFYYDNACLWNRQNDNQLFKNGLIISKQLYSLLQISSISSNIITTTTNHNLNNGDIIAFTGDSLPTQITQYDAASPYSEDKKVYYVISAGVNTFKISNSSGGSEITLSSGSGTIHKLNSQNLYRPFILNIRRKGNYYYHFINNTLLPVNSQFATSAGKIEDLKNTTLKLINRNPTIGINYFDFIFYKRNLSTSELQSTYSYLVNEYFSLFSGEPSSSSINLKSNLFSFRLPNIFRLAGKS